MKVRLAGLELANPVIAASGTFGYGIEFEEIVNLEKIGAFVTTGISLEPIAGHAPPRIVQTAAGMLNAIGRQNVGVDEFIHRKLPQLRRYPACKVIVNIFGYTVGEFLAVMERLNEAEGIAAYELNVSCPNLHADGLAFGSDPSSLEYLINSAKAASNRPLIVKLSPNAGSIVHMAKIAAAAGADAVSMVSTFRAMAINVETRRPRLSNITGGLSGPAIKPIALRMVYETAKVITIPIIGMGGIVTPEDAIEFLMAGATAVQVGTASLVDPCATERLANGLISWCRNHDVERVSSLTGALDSAIIWPTPAPIVYGTVLSTAQLNATASVPGTFAYTPDVGDVLTVGNHMLSVTFRPNYAEDYALAQANVLLSVVKATPAITWQEPAPIRYGIKLSTAQLNAAASVPGTFAYTPDVGDILTLGSQVLSVTFTPADIDTYIPVQADVPLTVVGVMPTITWPKPAPMAAGTELSSTQLNATASAPGTFAYTPDVGDKLPLGSHVLSVTFTPSDSTIYTMAQADISITVTKSMPAITWPELPPIVYGIALSAAQLNATASIPGTFTYTPDVGDVLTVGNHTLSATFTPTDTENHTWAQTEVLLSVAKATPLITWPELPPIVYGTGLSAAQLNATASVPGTFAYTPDLGSMLAAGSHVLSVTFTPTDTENYVSVQAEVSLNVAKATPTLTWPEPAPIVYGTELRSMQLNATASVPGTFAFTPASGEVLTVRNHMLSAFFTPTDSDNYSSAEVNVLLSVVKATPAIVWPDPPRIKYGSELSIAQLNAAASVQGTFAYTPDIGDVLAVGSHTLSVTFTPSDTTSYIMVQAEVSITVTRPMPTITWSEPTPIVYGAELSVAQLNATALVPGTFAYKPAIGEVLTAGNHILSATFTPARAEDYALAQSEVLLSVVKATPAIMWPEPALIVYGAELSSGELNATASVTGTSVYSHDVGGMLAAGSHVLSATFTPADTENYTSAQADVLLTVVKAMPTITWPEPEPIVCGTGLSIAQLNATASVPGTFAYSPAIGDVPPVGSYVLSVTFEPTDTENYTIAQSDVSVTVTRQTPTITWPEPEPIVCGTALSTAQLNAAASVQGTFAYTPNIGDLLRVGDHTLSVTFTPTDAEGYTQAQISVLIVVVKATPAITWPEPEPIVYGTALTTAQLNATASVQGTFAYTPNIGDLLTVGDYMLSATFTPADAESYTQAQVSVLITVVKATPEITWPESEPIAYGTALSTAQLNATASVQGTFAYTPNIGDVLTVGDHTLSVTFTPTDVESYTQAQVSVLIAVVKATPSITWSKPAPITYGNWLNSNQLNAMASVPGSFAYTPALGMGLTAGKHVLSVLFTPTDAANYATAQAEVSLSVTKATPAITWSPPRTISYGIPLSIAQLDATAPIEGTFVYTPAAGTVLSLGAQTISVTFIPLDTANYIAVETSMSIVVEEVHYSASFTPTKADADAEETSRLLKAFRIDTENQERRTPVTHAVLSDWQQSPLAPGNITAYAAIEETKRRALHSTDNSLQNSDPETRFYRGASYRKGGDGQWHLQK
jgi:dihydroorotate dehydrogenase subfamily 1